MGKLIFTPVQKLIFDEFSKDQDLAGRFYFTGGTALSVFYYEHRWSEDMDFFTEDKFSESLILSFIQQITKNLHAEYFLSKTDIAYIYKIFQKEEQIMKIDFVFNPLKRIEKGKEIQGVTIDSLRDIGANKLMTVTNRTQVKDFVDLYFLLQKDFTIWDLLYAYEAKSGGELDVMMLGSDLLKSETFEALPKMIKPLDLNELKAFFKDLAKKVASRVVE